ncbi:GNAT family N-acetyltransferase [Mesorhizobium dulcispinae]|uniref:GNAT family N-acetyltransferase n=1 Tax=Mesorhizobium dulcispinae TaxID=3072316 RepID=UPI002A243AE6|nr:GNAT family N-acetyltransferase [Mesorhizobium sp. VK23D]MDX8522736.1 GNAT family N-acetyltransferase [Mesorhizobium sp. VK23D]
MMLTTERLILRPWEDRDRSPMGRIYADPHVRRYLANELTIDEAIVEVDLAIERARSNGFHFQPAELKSGGQLVGMIGLGVLSEPTQAAITSELRVEIGWFLAKEHWGKGLASEGARAWLKYAWSLDLSEVAAFTAKANAPSQRVMQKIGMIYDPTSDYDDPRCDEGNWLRPQVVYRIRNPNSARAAGIFSKNHRRAAGRA